MIKTLLKSALAAMFLFGTAAFQGYAQASEDTVTIKIEQTTGTFTVANAQKTWAKEWTCTQTDPQVKFSCANNNMAYYDGTNLRLFTNQSPFRCAYTISASAGWAVKSYSFDFTAEREGASVTVTPEGKPAVTANGVAEKKSVNVDNGELRVASFEVSNRAATFAHTSNFVVTLVKKASAPQHNLMVTKGNGIPYRIPAIAVAGKSGHLTAVGDYRFSRADIGFGHIDLHIARSEDHGDTWTQPSDPIDERGRTVAKGNDGRTRSSAFGDAAIVGDHQSDSLIMLSVSGRVPFFQGVRRNPNPVARWYSPDGGKTWTQHEDITDHIYKLFDRIAPSGYIDSMFFGSGRIFQSHTVKVGSHYRLYAALTSYVKATGVMACWVLYSDDFGQNWHILGGGQPPIPSGGDEPKAEELPDGSVVISARVGGGRNYNIFTFSDVATAKGVWAEKAFSTKSSGGITASSNACNGEILILPVKRVRDNKQMFLALQSVPFGPSGRTKVGINYKELASPIDYNTPNNFAKGWDGTMLVTDLGSAYSTMVLQKDEKVGFFYEEETFTTTAGGGYTLVYKKYSVEDITEGAYTYDATSPRPEIDPTLANALDIAAARKVLANKGVGFPIISAAERTALNALLTKIERENTVTKEEVATAIAALQKADKVELPLDNRFYTLTFVAKDGKEYYMNAKGSALEIQPREAGVQLPPSASFVAKVGENGRYMLLTPDGQYLSLNGTKLTLETTATANAQLTLNKLMAGDKVMIDDQAAYGLITIQSQQKFWSFDVVQNMGVVQDEAMLNEVHTTAIHLEQVAPPLGATITLLSQVQGDKVYALYNAHFTTYAVKKPNSNNVWVQGMRGDAGHALQSTEYALPYDAFSPMGAWQLAKDKRGNWYLYNIGAKQYAKTGNPSVLNAKIAVKVKEIQGGLAFSTTGGDTDYFCAAPQLAGKPIANWRADDAGAKWVLVENPYVQPDMNFYHTITAVVGVEADQSAATQTIYDLQGQRINLRQGQQLPAGVYIVDGQKRIVR